MKEKWNTIIPSIFGDEDVNNLAVLIKERK
jgi:hypothetical protein